MVITLYARGIFIANEESMLVKGFCPRVGLGPNKG